METITNTITDFWESWTGKLLILGATFGAIPFYILTEAHAALT